MTKIVISQPMYFPWYGHLEQIRFCDTYVFYDDAKYSHGSFFNRVQLLSNQKQRWMTIPLSKGQTKNKIKDVYPSHDKNWKHQHLEQFKNLYEHTPYYKFAFDILYDVLGNVGEEKSLAQISAASTESLATAFGLNHVQYLTSSDLSIEGSGSLKVKNICQHLNASIYITGHGASKYLDHKLFEENGINIKYIDYGLSKYKQGQVSNFIPYVSALDCLAHCGPEAGEYLSGQLVDWKEFIAREAK